MNDRSFRIDPARPTDVADVHALIAALAQYERLEHLCVSTEADIAAALFGERPAAEVLIARMEADPRPAAGFALFFHTFSTFTGRPNLRRYQSEKASPNSRRMPSWWGVMMTRSRALPEFLGPVSRWVLTARERTSGVIRTMRKRMRGR